MDMEQLIKAALAEDIGIGDITTESIIPADAAGSAVIVAKEPLVLAGLDVAGQVFAMLDPDCRVVTDFSDGQAVETGTTVFSVAGRMRALLQGERTALNFVQRLSGIATLTRSYAEILAGSGVRLVDTRKTTPGWRALEKAAVRSGGGHNHRFGLFDGILIKDNHIVACGGITAAIERARANAHHLVKIEIEVSDVAGAEEAAAAGADVIMLDNMATATIKEAVGRINGRALIEVSGSVTRDRLAELAAAGVDIISAGSLTHSARAMDLSMRITAG
ncbi:MAG: carboxylating nicotinate-nucleotide diphosphorylase [Desulfosudaceae bacterium]